MSPAAGSTDSHRGAITNIGIPANAADEGHMELPVAARIAAGELLVGGVFRHRQNEPVEWLLCYWHFVIDLVNAVGELAAITRARSVSRCRPCSRRSPVGCLDVK